MRCNFEKLCLYVDSKLNETQRDEVLAHLHQCEICTEAVTQMSAEQDVERLVLHGPRRRAGTGETAGKGAWAKRAGLRSSVGRASQQDHRVVSRAGMGSPVRAV